MKKSIFLFFAAILCATSAWAGPSFKGGYVYFHNKGGWSKSSRQLCLGKNSYTETRSMTVVTNTQLWYNSLPTSGWTDATYMAVINNSSDWGSGNWGPSNLTNATHYTKKVDLGNWGFNSGAYQMLTPSSGSNNATLSLDWVGGDISAMNKTITIKAKVSIDKGATYAEKTSPGTLTASSFKFTNYKTCTTTTSLSSGKITCGYTANTTLTAQTDVEGYVFAGWYDDNGTRQTADATLTINPTADATYYAYYTAEPKHDVKITWVSGTTELQTSQTIPVGEETPYSVEAPKVKDYTFSGWTLGSGVQSANPTANPISITTKSGETDYTLVANYDYIEPVIKTIYCKMEYDWWYSDGAAISAYVWGDEEGEWKSAPGTLMALAPWETKVWKIDIDIARYPKVCFIRVKGDGSANWGAQTKDLDIPTDEKNLFTISNTNPTWASSSKCDGAWSVYTPAPIPDRYLTGNAAGFGMTIDGEGNEQWSPDAIKMTWNDATQKFTHTVSGLEANKYYKFRITDGTWAGKWGYSNLKSAIENVFGAEDNNISFVLAADGDLTITFDGTYIELTTTSSFAAPVYTIVGDAAVTGCHWDVNSVENQMVQDATDENQFTLVKTVTAVAGEYEYKAIRNHSYDWEVASGTKLTIEKDGTGTITYTLDVSTKKLTAVVSDWVEGSVAQDVKLVGIGMDREFTEAANHLTTSVDVVLEANSVYSFNIVANSVYLKNNGVMWRGNCEGWKFTNEGDKAHIITDLPGTYTFTWTYDGNKLSVKYPDGTNVPAPVFLAGKMNNWERLATRLIPSADGTTASATIELERNVYNEFRMVIGTEDWTNIGTMDRGNRSGWAFDKVTVENKDVNAGIIPDVTGEYTFTWSYAKNELSVTYPAETCTDCSAWYLCGSFNDWKLSNEFTKTATADVVEATLTLEAGTYTFKVQDMTDPTDGKWYGNNATMERNSTGLATGWTFATDKDHCTIVADIAGDYTFTWNTQDKKLTVTYPEIIIGDGDNSTILSLLNGKTVNLTVTRSFASGTLYTLVLPFAMDNNTVKSIFGANVELYDFTSLSENTSRELILSFTKQATPAIVAGTPYLIKPETNAYGFDLTGVTINTTTTTVEKKCGPTTITMQPVLSATAEAKTNGASQYWLAADNNLYNNVVSIKGLRVIFDVQTTKANVRARAAFNENETTSVDNIVTTDTPVKAIENGQLIIIRDGVKYNVQGQKL